MSRNELSGTSPPQKSQDTPLVFPSVWNHTEELIRLAVPSAAFVLLTNAYRIVDQYWVDRISVAAQAAVGATMFVLVVGFASFELVAAGAGPLIARATGAQASQLRTRIFGQSLAAALLLAAIWTIVGSLSAEQLAGTLGLESEAQIEAKAYIQTIALTSLPLVLTPLTDQTFLAMGDARTPLGLHALTIAANVILTPIFVIHLDGGVAGAALASNLSRALGTGWGLIILFRRTQIRLSNIQLGDRVRQILSIGAPIASSTALYGIAYWIMLRIAVSPLGSEVNAALGIGWSALEGVSWTIFHGVSMAVASIVGRSLGAGNRTGAYRSALVGLVPTALLGGLAAIVFLLGGETITRPFASNPEVHRQAILYASIIGYSQVFVALESTAEGVLAGAGATRAVFWTSAPLNLLRAPLAWLFAVQLDMGPSGLWWVIAATTILKAALKLGLVLRGHWMNQKL